MKRYLSVIVTLVLLVGLLAGCATTPTGETDSTTTVQNGSTTTTLGGGDTVPTGGEDITPPTDEQGNLVPTDPTGSGVVSTESTTLPPPIPTNAPKTGYAAVGYVNTAKKEAVVLLSDGKTGRVPYTGTAPKVGAVHKYKVESGKYTFTYLTGNTHLKSTSDQLSGSGCAIYMTPDGYMWTNASTEDKLMHYDLTDTPIFIRYSAVEWRLATSADIKKKSDSKYAVGSFFDAAKKKDYKDQDNMRWYTAGAIMLGNADVNKNLYAPDLTHFNNPKPNAILGTVPSATTLSPTTPTTKPTEATTGYAAVGEVKTSSKQAIVLLDTGEQKTITYSGTAPTKGALHKYQKSGNTYSLTLLQANTHYASCSQFSMGAALYGDAKEDYMWAATSTGAYMHYDVRNTPIFIRYSETQWRLVNSTAIQQNDPNKVSTLGYVFDAKRASGYADVNGKRWYLPGAIVIGHANNGNVYKANLTMFGNPSANVTLGSASSGNANANANALFGMSQSRFDGLFANKLNGLFTGTTKEKITHESVAFPNSTSGFHFPDVIFYNGQYWAYYITYKTNNGKPGTGLAVSDDGVNWTEKGAILQPDQNYDNEYAAFAGVWLDTDGTFYLVYEAKGTGSGNEGNIGLATSKDGIHWTKQGLILKKDTSLKWQDINIGTPDLFKEGNTWYLTFHGFGTEGKDCQIGLATGTNIKNLTMQKTPIVPTKSGTAWSGTTGRRDIIKCGGYYYMVFEVSTDMVSGSYQNAKWSHMFARSTDMKTWQLTSGPQLTQASTGFGYDGPCWMVINDELYVCMRNRYNNSTYVKIG